MTDDDDDLFITEKQRACMLKIGHYAIQCCYKTLLALKRCFDGFNKDYWKFPTVKELKIKASIQEYTKKIELRATSLENQMQLLRVNESSTIQESHVFSKVWSFLGILAKILEDSLSVCLPRFDQSQLDAFDKTGSYASLGHELKAHLQVLMKVRLFRANVKLRTSQFPSSHPVLPLDTTPSTLPRLFKFADDGRTEEFTLVELRNDILWNRRQGILRRRQSI